MRKNLLITVLLFLGVLAVNAQPIYNAQGIELKHTMTAEEAELYKTVRMETQSTNPPTGDIRPIAEYEPMEAVMIRYPFGIPFSLIKEMAKDIKVITIVQNASQAATVLNQYVSNQVDTSNCEFLYHATDSYWTRDYGPFFLAIDDSEVAIYDFTYNRPRYNDNQVNTALAQYLSVDRYASTLQLTGGNYMNDGTSQAASTTLTYTENPSWTHNQIAQHFEEYLGITDYHFLNDPLDDYIEHIDCWGKYLAPDKVMIGQVPPTDYRYQLYESVANTFANMTSPYGTPMQVFRVYTPGNNQTTPYTNSLILNNKVFVPISGNSNDAAAIASYQAAMPGYQIIGINYYGWENTDALHCRTHEIADREMLYIKHQPLHDTVDSYGTVTISTDLYSYGNHTILADSVIAYVRVPDGEYTGYNMTNTEGNTWSVNISGLPNGELEYYIFAADDSGRRECHPYIGAPDPHPFILRYLSTVPGDANGDSVVDITDITTTISYMMNGSANPFIFENADVNNDGAVNVLDIILMVNIIFSSK